MVEHSMILVSIHAGDLVSRERVAALVTFINVVFKLLVGYVLDAHSDKGSSGWVAEGMILRLRLREGPGWPLALRVLIGLFPAELGR